MNPASTTSADWSLVTIVNSSLVLFTLLVIVAALTFVAAHAIIPSLVSTYQLSSRAMLVRPAFYIFALVALLIALASLGQALTNAIVLINRLYPRWLI